jgi:membrane fusion protein (multidrug efflux system)
MPGFAKKLRSRVHLYYPKKFKNKSMKNIVVVVLVITLAGCGNHKPVDLSEKKAGATNIETVRIEKGTLGSTIKLPGELKPFQKVDIYPRVNGFVKEMYVDRGSVVHKGQILMTLEAPELDQQYEAAQSKLLQAQENLNASRDRQMRLSAAAKTPGAVSDLDLINAKSKYQADSAFERSEEANVNAVRTMKDYLVVQAPFEGIIIERNVHPGTLTGPNFKLENKPLLVLEENGKLRLEVFVPEEFTEKIDKTNKQIVFTTAAWPGRTFTADISRSSNSLYDNFRSEAVEADVPNADNTFKPGMYVEASIKVTSQVNSFIIPTSAIVTSTENKYVIIRQNGKLKFVNVKEGVSNNGKTEVYGDFTGDELVVKNPNDEMKPGI